MNYTKLYVALLLLTTANALHAASSHIDLDVDFKHDDNVGHAEADKDIRDDNITDLGLNYSFNQLLTPNSGLRLKAGVIASEHAKHSQLTNYTLSAGAAYRFQPVVGYTTPWIEIGATLARQLYRDSDLREGGFLDLQAMIGKNITDKISARAGVNWENRWSDEVKVFEWHHNTIFAMVDYKLGFNTTLYADANRTYGDQVFSSTVNPKIKKIAIAFNVDPALIEGGVGRAYRLGARADTMELGLSTAISPANTLDVGLRYFSTDADGGHSYDSTELRASWLYRFR